MTAETLIGGMFLGALWDRLGQPDASDPKLVLSVADMCKQVEADGFDIRCAGKVQEKFDLVLGIWRLFCWETPTHRSVPRCRGGNGCEL